jgi:hypothetical protein
VRRRATAGVSTCILVLSLVAVFARVQWKFRIRMASDWKCPWLKTKVPSAVIAPLIISCEVKSVICVARPPETGIFHKLVTELLSSLGPSLGPGLLSALLNRVFLHPMPFFAAEFPP